MSTVELRTQKAKRKLRVRKKIFGTYGKPRLSVFKSNNYISGQLIDDVSGRTLAALSENKVKDLHKGKTKMDAAYEVGKELAKVAQKNQVRSCVFDKSAYRYHGRVKNFAQGARDGGLIF